MIFNFQIFDKVEILLDFKCFCCAFTFNRNESTSCCFCCKRSSTSCSVVETRAANSCRCCCSSAICCFTWFNSLKCNVAVAFDNVNCSSTNDICSTKFSMLSWACINSSFQPCSATVMAATRSCNSTVVCLEVANSVCHSCSRCAKASLAVVMSIAHWLRTVDKCSRKLVTVAS